MKMSLLCTLWTALHQVKLHIKKDYSAIHWKKRKILRKKQKITFGVLMALQ